ncbi:hypothetical protein GCM10023113_35340 [Cellulomonas oligotrophica]|uniref:Uncharacterized protein n=1 Tax=Cellulomonas oligotrophica TaxID=931536 RepID=A0ABQ4DEQ0_9CELL|nr:hypothetical protein Col01nite_33650 [Cellulomonas oligotrophica]
MVAARASTADADPSSWVLSTSYRLMAPPSARRAAGERHVTAGDQDATSRGPGRGGRPHGPGAAPGGARAVGGSCGQAEDVPVA